MNLRLDLQISAGELSKVFGSAEEMFSQLDHRAGDCSKRVPTFHDWSALPNTTGNDLRRSSGSGSDMSFSSSSCLTS